MQIDFTHNSKELAEYKPKPTKVAHIFCRKNENESVYMCSVFIGIADNKVLVVKRYGSKPLFSEFLKSTNLETTFSEFLAYLKRLDSTDSFEANREELRNELKLVYEMKLVDRTIVHALDFTQTEEYNREPKNTNASINKIIDSIK